MIAYGDLGLFSYQKIVITFIVESHGSGVHMWDLSHYDFVQLYYVTWSGCIPSLLLMDIVTRRSFDEN